MVTRYPQSIYAKDAYKRMIFIKNRLSEYDLSVAQFYLERKAWISAIRRCQELQKTYPDTSAAKQSLQIQEKAYQALGLKQPYENTQQQIDLNPAS